MCDIRLKVVTMNIRNTFCAALMLLAGASSASDFGLHLGSKHGILMPEGKALNDTNPGAYVRHQGYTLGFFRNSWSDVPFNGEARERWSVHASRDFSYQMTAEVEASLSVGAITGYPVAPALATSRGSCLLRQPTRSTSRLRPGFKRRSLHRSW